MGRKIIASLAFNETTERVLLRHTIDQAGSPQCLCILLLLVLDGGCSNGVVVASVAFVGR